MERALHNIKDVPFKEWRMGLQEYQNLAVINNSEHSLITVGIITGTVYTYYFSNR